MKQICIAMIMLVLIGCGVQSEPKHYSLSQGSMGYDGDTNRTPCLILDNAKGFWIDRVDVGDLVRECGGDVWTCNAAGIGFVVTNEATFRAEFVPKMNRLAKRLRSE